jgi:hypothetical protein
MSGVSVRVCSVTVDSPYTPTPGRTRYRVTLECGCYWWEERDSTSPLPAMNTVVRCHAAHSQKRIAISPREFAVAADRG